MNRINDGLNKTGQKEIYDNFINKSKIELLDEIKKENQVETLLFYGYYTPATQNKEFGFFEDIVHESGKVLYYPYLNIQIDTLLIFNSELIRGKKYKFDVKLASGKERLKRKNPFFLQASNRNIEQIIELSGLEEDIKLKKQEKISLENNISEIKEKQVEEEENIQNQFSTLKAQKQKELDDIIKKHDKILENKINAIYQKEDELDKLNGNYRIKQNELDSIKSEREKMEASIKYLQRKIDTCKNLEFLSKKEAESYLLNLQSDNPNIEGDFLDFNTDLDGSFANLSEHILNYLYHKKNLIYTEFQIKNFITLLQTNDTIILSGLSGSGKTQIVKSMAEAIGGVAKIIPVKPNWTSSDDLLGYYNPIQSSFLPTPFTEAIAEAIQNPHQMYLICLDEMNLARVEYYFADFLSKLEERNKQPEIELYAQHEEELFISEFKTLISLIESSINKNDVTSWNDFLENDEIRNRFFELLGNTENDTLLQIHSKMKRRLIDILKFPSTIKIPDNIRFIGAINVDETTNYFSPKILDRVHIVRFENPLLFSDLVDERLENNEYARELKPVYMHPSFFEERKELPPMNDEEYKDLSDKLKFLNEQFLLPLSIDFGVRSIRQSINYAKLFAMSVSEEDEYYPIGEITLNTIIMQKILPRFLFENSNLNNEKSKADILEDLKNYILETTDIILIEDLDSFDFGVASSDYLDKMLENKEQINFWAISSNLISKN